MAAKPPPRQEDERITEIPNLIRDPTSCRYLPTSIIGTGGFASVWRAKLAPSRSSSDPSSEPTECALKVVRTAIKSQQLRTRFQFELAIHSKLRHPHIVQFHRAFTFGTQPSLTYIALSLCENGSLTDVVKRRRFLTMPEIRRYIIQLAGAVEHLHSRDVVHRDIKAGNVFLDANMDVKLGDFGLAACLEPSATDANLFHRRTTFCGTPNYLAPELLSRKGHARGVDIWALGILVYYLAVGAAPFHSKKKEDIYKRVANKEYGWPVLGPDANEIPAELRELVGSILVEEELRPRPAQIVRHEFFTQGYVPERIDSLARTRRPRWARPASSGSANTTALSTSGTSSSTTSSMPPPQQQPPKPSTYDSLLASSFTLSLPRHESVLLSVQRELEAGITLRIPMAENSMYDAFAPLPAVTVSNQVLPKRKRERGRDGKSKKMVEVRMEEDAGIGGDEEGDERAEDALRKARSRRVDAAPVTDTAPSTIPGQRALPQLSLWPTSSNQPPASLPVSAPTPAPAPQAAQTQRPLPATISATRPALTRPQSQVLPVQVHAQTQTLTQHRRPRPQPQAQNSAPAVPTTSRPQLGINKPMPLSPSTGNRNSNSNIVRKAVARIDAKLAPSVPTTTSMNIENDENGHGLGDTTDTKASRESKAQANAQARMRMGEKPVRNRRGVGLREVAARQEGRMEREVARDTMSRRLRSARRFEDVL